MKVKYIGKVPHLLQTKDFFGQIKEGDIVDISKETLDELSLEFEIVKEKSKKKEVK